MLYTNEGMERCCNIIVKTSSQWIVYVRRRMSRHGSLPTAWARSTRVWRPWAGRRSGNAGWAGAWDEPVQYRSLVPDGRHFYCACKTKTVTCDNVPYFASFKWSKSSKVAYTKSPKKVVNRKRK